MSNERGVDHTDLIGREMIKPGAFPLGVAQERLQAWKPRRGAERGGEQEDQRKQPEEFHGSQGAAAFFLRCVAGPPPCTAA